MPIDVRLIGGPLNARMGPSGVWTGEEVIIWGGYHTSGGIVEPVSAYPASGAAYTLYGDDWRRIAKAPIPGRYRHIAGWTGREMIVWGGYTENWRQGTASGRRGVQPDDRSMADDRPGTAALGADADLGDDGR